MQDDKTYELDKECFFARFPRKAEDAHKGSSGKILIVTGGWGMAGAACLNILGAKALGAKKLKIGIVEENQVLRKWYESNGFIHLGTKKFDFFPFTCGYMEQEL